MELDGLPDLMCTYMSMAPVEEAPEDILARNMVLIQLHVILDNIGDSLTYIVIGETITG